MRLKSKWIAVATIVIFSFAGSVSAQQEQAKSTAPKPEVDPQAVKVLRNMTDYLSGLKQFSVRVRNMDEDLLESGHKVDYDMTIKVTVSRPNKLRNDRLGHLVNQSFYYNGKTLTMYNASLKVYATVPAPATIEGTIDYARDSLGITAPVTDLIYRNSFALLMQDVTLAMVLGEEVINEVKCTHLLFSRPGVDFQVWVGLDGHPLPYKYVVTDTGTPALLSVTSLMSDWNTAPAAPAAEFEFVPPPGAVKTEFLPIDATTGN
jgi:hypothetical protein